jgi:endogenous inhibitor of DNA gyrase (YacG/DUF329 family)
MTLIECPKCKREVEIDAANVTKEQDGLDLIVTCPRCKTPFIIQQVALVRKKLLEAQYAFVKDKTGRTRRIQIGGARA